MTPCRRPVGRPQGFTLLEIVIAMTLLALISGICYAAFHLGIRAVAKGEVAVVTAQRLRVATDVLIHQVKSAAANPALVEGDTYPYFYGTPTTMSFVTDAGQLAGGGRSRVTYRINADPPQLVLEESPYFDAASLGEGTPDAAEVRSAVILDGFRDASFEFFDGSDSGECPSSGWCKTWDYTTMEVLPSAVRITVDGLPGLDQDTWGQEIPIMVAMYGDAPGELPDDGGVQDCEGVEAGDDEDTADTPGPTNRGGSNAVEQDAPDE